MRYLLHKLNRGNQIKIIKRSKQDLYIKEILLKTKNMDFIVEMKCPMHGFERFRIKVIRKYNIPSSSIEAKLVSRPKKGEIRQILVGRGVKKNEIQKFLNNYFHHKGISHHVLAIKSVGTL